MLFFSLQRQRLNKIPDTILSRVIRFDLTKIGESDMRDHLQNICKQEALMYEEEALDMIVQTTRKSQRFSHHAEKCIIEKSLTTKNVESALHLVNATFLRETFEAIRSGKSTEIQTVVSTLEDESTDIRQFSAQMTEWIVDNIDEAFAQKAFPIYREIFDMFTQIFIQSRQVAVPIDILRMALYERIQDTVIPLSKKTIQAAATSKRHRYNFVRYSHTTTRKRTPTSHTRSVFR